MRWARALAVLALIAMLVAPSSLAIAEDEPGKRPVPADPSDWLGAVVQAAAKDDHPWLVALARAPAYDPWMAIDALHARGEFEDARAFARALRTHDAEAAAVYASSVTTDAAAVRRRIEQAATRPRADDEEAFAVLLELGADVPLVVRVRAMRAAAERHEGAERWKTALGVYVRIEALAREAAWYLGQLQALDGQVGCCEQTGDGKTLGAVFERRIDLAESAGDVANAIGTRIWQAGQLANEGRLRAAADTMRALLPRLQALGLRRREGEAHATLATILNFMGRLASSLHHSAEAERLFRLTQYAEGMLYARSAAISTYVGLGLDEYAVLLCDAQIDLAGDEAKHRSYRSQALLVRAVASARLGRLDASAKDFNAALDLLDPDTATKAYADVLLNRGSELYARTGDVAKAREDFKAVEGLEDVSIRLRGYARAFAARIVHGPDGEALAAAALTDARESEDGTLLVLALAEASRAALDAKKPAVARKVAWEGVQLSLGAAARLGVEHGSSYRGRDGPMRVADALLRASVATGDPSDLIAAYEASRATQLLHAMGGRARVAKITRPHLLEESILLLGKRREELTDRVARARALKRRKRARALDAELTDVRERIRGLEARVDGERSRAVGLVAAELATAKAIQAWLQPDEALVQIGVVDEALHVVVVRKDASEVHRVPAKALLASIPATLAELQDSKAVPKPGAHGLTEKLAALATGTVGSILLPKSCRTVIVVPAPELASLPWPLFGRAWGDRDIVLAPSASVLLRARHVPIDLAGPRIAVGVSDYTYRRGRVSRRVYAGSGRLSSLPLAAEEAREVAGARGRALVDADATEEAVVGRLTLDAGRRSIVHFACHGLVNAARPGLSSLALHPSAADDGFLSAAEILGVPFECDLVVLSVCDVGSTHERRGQGAHGLPTALVAAGADRVLANLWRVDDKAGRAFMQLFYAALEKTKDVHAALRAAQRELPTRDPKWKHPYYWAGWVLWGTPR